MAPFTLKTHNPFDPISTPNPGPASLPTRRPLSYTLRPLPPALTLPQRISPSPREPTIRKRTTRTHQGPHRSLSRHTSSAEAPTKGTTLYYETQLLSFYKEVQRMQRFFYAGTPSAQLPRASALCARAVRSRAAEAELELAALQYVQWLHTRAVVVKPRVVFEAIGDGEQELEWERRRGVVEELRERSRTARRGARVCVYGEGRAERERRWKAPREEEREVRRAEEPRGLTGVVFRGRLGGMEALRALVSRRGEADAGEVDGWDWDWIRGNVEGPARSAVRVDSLAEEFDRLVLDDETRGLVESWKGSGGEELEGDESDDCGTVIYSPGDSEEDDD